ncbi:hypothetical protein [uncultured Chloroflexus sp.]|nr:hypothetical protein [uncultured Chloroflexus sp.]
MRLLGAIFLLFCGFYLLTMSGHTYSADEETMLAVTRSLIERGDVAVLVEDGAPVAALRPGRNEQPYSPYGLLPSLLAIPFHRLGELIAPIGRSADFATRFTVTMLNSFVTAATCAVLARWAWQLGASTLWAAILALLYGLATFAWPYARTFFSEPLAGLLILIAAERAYAAWRYLRPPARWTSFLISGLAAGFLLTTRIAAGVVLPIISGYVLWEAWRRSLDETSALQFTGSARRIRCVVNTAGALTLWIIGTIPGLLLFMWYNLARFDTPLASGYASEAYTFTTPLQEGLIGLLFSSGKSVFLFAPPILLALPGGIALWRRGERTVVLFMLGLFGSHVVLYACWGQWPGGGVWGPRFLLPVVAPLVVLGAGVFLREALQPAVTYRRVALAVLTGLLGFAGNLGGVLLNFDTYVVLYPAEEQFYQPAASPLVGHWRLLVERWQRYGAAPPVCHLGDGLYATEATDGAIFPRRTGAHGIVNCTTVEGARLRFILDDRRPHSAPTSGVRFRLNGYDLGRQPQGQRRVYNILIEPGRVRLEIIARP